MKNRLPYQVNNKEQNIKAYTINTLNKISTMFKYHDLPATLPQRNLENFLVTKGFACIAKVNDNLYAFTGGLGGEPNPYNEPTICTVANPALKLSKDFVIDNDCVIIRNDSYMQGMLDIIDRYSTFLVETDITTSIALINTRLTTIFSVGDSQTMESAKQYLNDITNGKLGVVADNTFIESLKLNNVQRNQRTFDELITLNQYLKASLLNEIGLNANTQLKKERLITAEVESNSDSFYPIVDDMLNQRREGLEKVNNMFDTNITVEFNSSWDYRIFNGMSIHNTDSEINYAGIENVSRETSDDMPADEPTDKTSDDITTDKTSDVMPADENEEKR